MKPRRPATRGMESESRRRPGFQATEIVGTSRDSAPRSGRRERKDPIIPGFRVGCAPGVRRFTRGYTPRPPVRGAKKMDAGFLGPSGDSAPAPETRLPPLASCLLPLASPAPHIYSQNPAHEPTLITGYHISEPGGLSNKNTRNKIPLASVPPSRVVLILQPDPG